MEWHLQKGHDLNLSNIQKYQFCDLAIKNDITISQKIDVIHLN